MTIKEIAELTGKARRTIQDWVTNNTGENRQNILVKTAKADNTKIPADFSLEETIEIMKAGKISEGIISLLKENAEKKSIPAITETVEIVKNILEPFLKQQNEFNKMLLQEIKSIKQNKQPEQKLLLASQATKIEVEIMDLPPKYSRAASAAVNNIIRKEERQKRFNELCPELF